jgi:hypothetical protein
MILTTDGTAFPASRPGGVEAASTDYAWGGCLIGDPACSWRLETTLLSAWRIIAHRLLPLSLCNHIVVSSASTRLQGESKDLDLLGVLASVVCPYTCLIGGHPRHHPSAVKDETDRLRCCTTHSCVLGACSHGVGWFHQIRHLALPNSALAPLQSSINGQISDGLALEHQLS